ncbi:DUF4407 domain-containing protein [Robiginitalea biformata]|uniref:DUF4407 domain-containing protein n=1 Tax=Robiginitalea biformata (strain ATCC BAA-864 / DSM 15991 / KCTC 12146 / HTCC2501) TaxID=313596 RepID=A4CHQ5_ROBBH|nr:DUF4407 domain-containing protein [Robiginitalea biformata]EAR16463.1 hypothetical protein RB2501_06175 [Robiginitalea biformata HTCC2501]
MKDWWLKLGCFLTGYNYYLLKNSSEASAKSVKKYLSAILIISILWAFIGYSFAKRYLKTDDVVSIIVALIMVIVVIQIERQIILNISQSIWPKLFRGLIAIVMAIIGSVIIDQIVFKEDVEKIKIAEIQSQVDEVVPARTRIIQQQIFDLDSLITVKENALATTQQEFAEKPQIRSVLVETREELVQEEDSSGQLQDVKIQLKDYKTHLISNPIGAQIPVLDEQIQEHRRMRMAKEDEIVNIRAQTEKELSEKTGLLDEITILFKIILSSWIAGVVWGCIFLFFLSIELFVLISKSFESDSDYDRLVRHQKEMKLKMIAKME